MTLKKSFSKNLIKILNNIYIFFKNLKRKLVLLNKVAVIKVKISVLLVKLKIMINNFKKCIYFITQRGL